MIRRVLVVPVVLGALAGCSGRDARDSACGRLQPVADSLAAVAARADRVDLDGGQWERMQEAIAAADDEARDAGDAILTRAVYRLREQAARADAAGRADRQEQFRTHLVEAATSLDDAVKRCDRFGHDVRWRPPQGL